ncbi:ATP-dependent DNA helicase PcrA [Rubricoccus marinus]|uniref:DNA 3'-5' helicase n=1 Tax=Rubricoccus marinus TaxID=716817 RepID=A0A259U3V2_9BACT|nr:ATP-dependent DNA helicase PcrA [Rubricoccus marinus]
MFSPEAASGADEKRADELLEGLNPVQQEAVRASEGAVMIIAGPGSGKTRTLTHRIAYLIAARKAWPSQILALTFTNKAAREMRTRVTDLVGPDAKGMWMGTFHSVFSRVLRREADKIGFSRDFSIYDTDDQERLLRELMLRQGVDAKKYTPRSIRGRISSAKNQMMTPEAYAALANDPYMEVTARLYGPYNQRLRKANAMDFDDLLAWPIRLFEQHPDVLADYQRRWRYIHIDEYQDTNKAQYLLAKLLAAEHQNICVVGDDAQSIYAFRGADIGNILSFQNDYPEATTIRLEQNYRSTQKIVRFADAIIKGNTKQLDKKLWTENDEGEPVRLMEALSERDESQKIERTIRDLHVRGGIPWKQFAVLYRTNAQSRSMEESLRRGGIPYRMVGGTSFYQRKEIKDALAYLRLAVNPSDDASLLRVINTPTRGIGGKTVDGLRRYAAEHGLSLWQAAQEPSDAGLSSRAAGAVEKFAFLVARFASKAPHTPADELAREYIQETGLLQSLRDENTPESLVRLENIHELLNAVAEFAQADSDAPRTLSEFLQEVSLVSDVDRLGEEENRVTLMTLHASKGLEFKVVFVTGMEEGLFPLAKAAQDPTELEEERRLFYVGATRAEEILYLSYARTRYRYGESTSAVRSRFLDELDGDDLMRTESGARFAPRKDRFQLPDDDGAQGGYRVEYDADGGYSYESTPAQRRAAKSGYEQMDPHYYRTSLRPDAAKPARKKKASGGERSVEYEPGVAPEAAGSDVVPGVKVVHGTFGEGKVIAIEGKGERAAATVHFPRVGQKKLKLKFARLRVIG